MTSPKKGPKKESITKKQIDELCLWATGKTWDELQPKTDEEKFWQEVWLHKARQEMLYGRCERKVEYKVKRHFDDVKEMIEMYYPNNPNL